MLLFNSFTSTILASTSKTKHQRILQEDSQQDQLVLTSYEKKTKLPLIIELKEQVDTSLVAKNIKNKLNSEEGITPFQRKIKTRYAVVDALQTNAKTSQVELLNYIEEETKVEDVRSFYIINLISLTATEEDYKKLLSHPKVANIRLDQKIEIEWPTVEEDGKLAQTQIKNDEDIEWNIKQIEADKVWNEYGIDGSGVVVGIIDSGVHWNHEALKEKWRGYDPNQPDQPNPTGNWFDAVEGQSMPYDIASNPHGTHVAGTILGEDSAGNNKIGVAPGAEWIAAKAFTIDGGMDSWLLAAGEFMLAPNDDPSLSPDIINNSWGGGPGLDEWYRPMVQAWRDAEIIPIFAAGNTNTGSVPGSVSAPSNYPESFAVGATDNNNQRGDFSHQGPGPYDDIKPDISAPGVNIRSAVPGGYQAGWNGTSMAAPHISGVAAMLRSIDSSLEVDEIETILKETATSLVDNQYSETPNYGYGYGLVNAYEAVGIYANKSGKITGTVLKQGEDHDKPVIEHEPITFSYEGLPEVVRAKVSDEVSITKVEFLIKKSLEDSWETIEMNRIEGDFREGIYEIEIPLEYIKLPHYEYKLRATDFSGNEEETDIHFVDVSFGINPGDNFTYDFTSELKGIDMSGDWEIGEPTVGPKPLTGNYLLATNLSGNYSNKEKSTFTLPPIDVREVSEIYVSFEHWFDIEYEYDLAKVLIRQGEEEWTELASYSGRERSWFTEEIDLTDYISDNSEKQLFLSFVLESDERTNHAGWYIDYMEIKGVTKENETEVTLQSLINSKRNETSEKQGLPVEAYVTVLETGRTVKTSLEDGSFTMLHQPTSQGSSYTLRVESYGYYPEERSFELPEDETIYEEFLLTEIPRGELELTVIDDKTNQPVEGVEINLQEDPRVEKIETDENGLASFEDLLEGTYTLSIHKPNYYYQEIELTVEGDSLLELEVLLEGFPGEVISYDDGYADNARAFNSKDFAFATRFTPEEHADIIGVSVYLWGKDFPVPGGNEFYVTIYNAEDETELMSPKKVEGIRGQWNFIDLSNENLSTEKDYYVAIIQPVDFEQAVGLGVDETGEFANRTYLIDDGNFEQLGENYGNWMIRSHLVYEGEPLHPPILTEPSDVYTKEDHALVEGTVNEDGIVRLYNNGEEALETVTANQSFSLDFPLVEGDNHVYATFVNDAGDESEQSNEIFISKKTSPPVISNIQPSRDMYLLAKEDLTISFTSDVREGSSVISIKDNNGRLLDQLNMEKVDSDVYETTWSYSPGEEFTYAVISILHEDLHGNKVELELDEKIYPIDRKVSRLYGQTRYDTASLISERGWEEAKTIILATGLDFSDALAGIPLSKQIDAPILLTKGIQLEDSILSEIERLGAENVIILGGSLAVPEKVEDSLLDLGLRVDRIYGQTRIDTAVAIANYLGDHHEKAFIVNALDYPDALSAASLAAQFDAPILLTKGEDLSPSTAEALEEFNVKESVIVGGTLAISKDVENLLPSPSRISGTTRFDTNIEVLNEMNLQTSHVFVATGWDFADALTGAALAVKRESGLLLLDDKLLESTVDFIEKDKVKSMTVFGGKLAVSEDMIDQLTDLLLRD